MKKRYLILPLAGVALIAALGYASAQATPDTANGRYCLTRIDGGWLRLDTQTGAVSTCTQTGAALTCRAAADERAALEAEIARLQKGNAALKQELVRRGIALPDGMAQGPAVKPEDDTALRLPSDADIDRVMTVIEKVWKRMMDLMGPTETPPGRPG
jgi:hypothetical protein